MPYSDMKCGVTGSLVALAMRTRSPAAADGSPGAHPGEGFKALLKVRVW